MSYKAAGWAFHQRLKPIPKLVLMHLADAHNGIDGRCFPSIAAIADGCWISESSVNKFLIEIEGVGLITRNSRYIKDRQTSNEYILHFDKQLEEVGSVKNTPKGSVKNTPINNGSLTEENRNTLKRYSNAPDGAPGPTKRKLLPVPVESDPYACLTPPLIPTTEAKPVLIPKAVAPIVERWFEVGVHHGPATKALRNGVRAVRDVLSGKFFNDKPAHALARRRYHLNDIRKALDVFDLKRNSPDHLPANKKFLKSLGLAEFFYSPHTQNGNGNGGGSIFLQCLEQGVVPSIERYPELTAFAVDQYQDRTGKVLQRDGAGRVANKVMGYWGEREGWLKQRGVATPKRLVVEWFDMLVVRRGGDWDVGNILSQSAVGAFESYLTERGN